MSDLFLPLSAPPSGARYVGNENKIPVHPFGRFNIDARDRSHYVDYQTALATRRPITIVVGVDENDRQVALDFDGDVLDGTTRDLNLIKQGIGWASRAAWEFAKPFLDAGCALELSSSLINMHLYGHVVDKSQFANYGTDISLPDGKKIQFFRERKPIAFGGGYWQGIGRFDADVSHLVPMLLEKLQLKASALPQQPTGPRPGALGQTLTDDQLIEKALNAHGSAATAFGDAISFRDLWEKNIPALVKQFASDRSTNEGFDHHRADAALMRRLAFWTGCDPSRMHRLFSRSALGKRDKWMNRRVHPTYDATTITDAIARCTAIYDGSAAQRAKRAGDQSETSSGVLYPHQMEDWFAGCVYVAKAHSVFDTLSGVMMKPPVFDAMKGGKRFVIDWEPPSNIITSAFTALTENRIYNFPTATSTCFKPNEPSGAIIDGDVNIYFPDPQPSMPGDATPFIEHIRKLLPNERDQRIILSWMASLVQNKGVKCQWAVVLQGVQGNGKTFVAEALQACIGQRYCHTPAAEDLSNKFNGFLEGKMLINVEEVHMQGRRELMDQLKPQITNRRVEIQNKTENKRMIDNVANWFFTTNHRNAIVKTGDDRRYAVFFTAQQSRRDLARDGMGRESGYFTRLFDWAENQRGYAIIHDFLLRYQIDAEFNPLGQCRDAPDTSSTAEAIKESFGPYEQVVEEAIAAERTGFKNGLVSSAAVSAVLSERFKKHDVPQTQTITRVMANLGYIRVGESTRNIHAEGGRRPTIYAHEDLKVGLEFTAEYILAQGYGREAANDQTTPPGFPTTMR